MLHTGLRNVLYKRSNTWPYCEDIVKDTSKPGKRQIEDTIAAYVQKRRHTPRDADVWQLNTIVSIFMISPHSDINAHDLL